MGKVSILIVILALYGCASKSEKDHEGCEYYSYFSINTYLSCGEKDLTIETKAVKIKRDKKKKLEK